MTPPDIIVITLVALTVWFMPIGISHGGDWATAKKKYGRGEITKDELRNTYFKLAGMWIWPISLIPFLCYIAGKFSLDQAKQIVWLLSDEEGEL